MTQLTGDALPPAAFSTLTRREAQGRAQITAPAGEQVPRTAAELRAALAALPQAGLRRGYRPEAVDRLVDRVALELDRRARGEAPYLLAQHVHCDGVGVSRPGYAVGPTRALLAAAAEALRV
ncbi:MAG: hypothetical protein JWP95_2246 [Actinotalea sp.]|nr:hypothetical protein [Actinotalea sp.]